ncbi:carbohydrate-binding family 9-like protein [Winogradskyella sp. UBA3174]|mgnify:CR=1 FL=1|uniref:carbohydrate-binding family 9-like protein n=1 Tax=Winogradskyella sp. UBA3174 TaxID=1947785 RepID=UPI0025CF5DE7|nr:carbohydrate-binding family 9-like protein [Winogradskyella sp. UBA3174]|tara:strand:- start:26121 stop:27218 length:1098 start_codon:yes stop_codon:yes gene_type:complete
MKQISILVILIVVLSCNDRSIEASIETINLADAIINPKHYIITKTDTKLVIDGIANETAWANSKFTSKFIDIEGVKTPRYETKVKMLWDDRYLYVYAKMEEPHIWGDITKRDAIIYLNNDFEVFIDPSQTGYGYGEIEINALNTVWDLYLDKPYRSGGKANFHWNLNALKSAVYVDGSINNPNKLDNFWAVEMAIPLKPFLNLKNRSKTSPIEGEQWKLNFSRVQWDFNIVDGKYQRKKEDGKFLPEYNWVWSNQKVINMHEPEKWGILQFTEQTSTEGIIYNEDPDLLLKQVAYALYRETKFKSLKFYLKQDVGTSKSLRVAYTKSDTLSAVFHKTNFGFEYVIESQISNTTYSINEQGILKTL